VSGFSWDPWQRSVLDFDGNICIRSGRQVGKSEVVSAKAAEFALLNDNSSILIIAASQRQSGLLFEKVRGYLEMLEEEGEGCLFAEPPTLTKFILANGSKIYCLPAGRTGHFIRGFTVDLLIADEAAYIPEVVWNAVIPMIAVSRETRSKGFIILLSTPFGKGGYYYNSFTDKDFKSFHVSSEKCSRIPQEFLRKERLRMSKAEYRQEYQGEFCDEWNQFFSSDLIKQRMSFIDWKLTDKVAGSRFYLGVDIARYGGDENAFVVVELVGSKLRCVKCFVTSRISTVDTVGRVLDIDNYYKFSKIFVDDAGVGGGVTDFLLEKLGRKVLGLNNASKRLQVQGEEKKRGILKEDLYSNCLMLLETGKLELISDRDLLRSLKSITYEYREGGNVKIFGDYSHLSEALVRACWCVKERGLDIYVY